MGPEEILCRASKSKGTEAGNTVWESRSGVQKRAALVKEDAAIQVAFFFF